MRFLFFTDPHLGKRLRSHTTTSSQEAMVELLYQQADGCLALAISLNAKAVCLGDLFDQYSNKENIIKQGLDIAGGCAVTLQGNHDVKNLKGEPSSLDLVASVLKDGICVNPDPTRSFVQWKDSWGLCLIPHHFTQEAFAEALRQACESPRASEYILCLHCNVMEKLQEDSSLYLTPELEKLVRSKFKMVLVGHEHEPKRKPAQDGQCELLILGNTFPLGFGEIANRYAYEIDSDTLEVQKHLIWDASINYSEVSVEDFLKEGFSRKTEQFIKVTGTLPFDRRAELNKALVRAWKNCPSALAINIDTVEIIKPLTETLDKSVDLQSIPELLKLAAEKAGFSELYKEIENEIVES